MMRKRRIRMTGHAMETTSIRGIDRVDIERIINEPVQTIKDKHEGRYKSFGIVLYNDSYRKRKETRYLIIVHNALNNHDVIDIITAMFTDKGGVRANGFAINNL